MSDDHKWELGVAKLQYHELEERIDNLRGLLKQVEWSATIPHHIPACPICGRSQDEGHAKGCKMAEAVKDDS